MATLPGDTTALVGNLWPESYIALQEIEAPASLAVSDPYRDIANFFIIIGMVIYLIFAHRRILQGVKIVFQGIFSQKRLISIEAQKNLQVCRNSLFLFLTICASFIFANIAYATKIIGHEYTVPLKFAGIAGCILAFFLLRRMAFRFLTWLNRNPAFKLAHLVSHTYTCIWYITVLCCFLVIKAIPSAPMGNMRYCIIYSLLAIMTIYFSAIFKIFISKGISHFFYILYLCTLEILPVALLLHLNFN